MRFFNELATEVRQLLAQLGLPSLAAATGRTDLLEQVRFDAGLNLKPLLARCEPSPARPAAPFAGRGAEMIALKSTRPSTTHGLRRPWRPTKRAGRIRSKPTSPTKTAPRELASQASSPCSKRPIPARRAPTSPSECAVRRDNRFGAFETTGMTLQLEGLANDFVGKGLCGGELVLRALGPRRQGERPTYPPRQRGSLRGNLRMALRRGARWRALRSA